MLKLLFRSGDLAAPPADKVYDAARMPPDRVGIVYGWNLSPFVFQIQDETGQAITIALPFCPFKHRLNVRTEKLIIHADSAAMVPAAPLGANDLRFWIDVSPYEQDLIPGPW